MVHVSFMYTWQPWFYQSACRNALTSSSSSSATCAAASSWPLCCWSNLHKHTVEIQSKTTLNTHVVESYFIPPSCHWWIKTKTEKHIVHCWTHVTHVVVILHALCWTSEQVLCLVVSHSWGTYSAAHYANLRKSEYFDLPCRTRVWANWRNSKYGHDMPWWWGDTPGSLTRIDIVILLEIMHEG